MKKLVFLSLLLNLLLINSCSEDIEEDMYDINEGQLNWKKYAFAQLDQGYTGISDISFVSDKIGYMIGFYDYYESYARVYKTIDGGLSWTKYYGWSGGAASLGTSIHFFSESNGYMIGEGMGPTVYKVENNEISFLEIDSLSNAYGFRSPMFFVDSDNGVIKNKKTTDGGKTWQSIFNEVYFNINDYYFWNNKKGACCTRNGIILKTRNFGDSWDTLYTSNDYEFKCIYMIDTLTIIAGGTKIIKSNDGGVNWYNVSNEASINDIDFVNDQIGFAASQNGKILKTYDAGETWQENYHSDFMKFKSLCVIDNQIIIAAGAQSFVDEDVRNFYIIKTTTQGE